LPCACRARGARNEAPSSCRPPRSRGRGAAEPPEDWRSRAIRGTACRVRGTADTAMCGVFGIFGHPEAANLTCLGLHALQHRGQESAGIATSDGRQLSLHRGMGHVIDVFPPEHIARLRGTNAIGHVRYSTAGGSFLKNAQPIAVEYARGSIALAHNGNLTNADELREQLEARGSIFQTTSDTEVIVHLLAKSEQKSPEDRIADALSKVQGAYSLLCLTPTSLIAARDPRGLRPLCLG